MPNGPKGEKRPADVIGNAVLGAVMLESLGLMVNPFTRKLVPMRLLLSALTTPRVPATP
jgi:hypothetical protein